MRDDTRSHPPRHIADLAKPIGHLLTAGLLLGLALMGILSESLSAQREAFEKAYRQGDWNAAAVAAQRWAERKVEDPTAAYNAACAFSLAGNATSALAWLEHSGTRGFAGVRSIAQDPDLEFARSLPGFEAATAGIRANAAKRFAIFQKEAESSKILTLVPPGKPEGPRPLIVVLHGYGGKPENNAAIYREAAAELGAIIAAPSALRPGPNGQGFSWTFRDEAEWWVLRAIERVSAEHDVDPDRILLAGFSQGANVALAVGLEHPDRFAGLLAVAGHYDRHQMPVLGPDGPRVYLLTGARDPAAETFEQAAQELSRAGLAVHLRVIQGLGHAFPPRPHQELRTGLAFLLAR